MAGLKNITQDGAFVLGWCGSEANENNPNDDASLNWVPNANKPLALAQFKFLFDMNNYTNIVTD